MKAIINLESFDGKLEVKGGKAVISRSDESAGFSVYFEEVPHPQIDKVTILPGSDLRIKLEQDGQVIVISESIYHKGKLAVRRFKRPKTGESLKGGYLTGKGGEYLTGKGQWAPEPKGGGPPHRDILLIPISFSKEA